MIDNELHIAPGMCTYGIRNMPTSYLCTLSTCPLCMCLLNSYTTMLVVIGTWHRIFHLPSYVHAYIPFHNVLPGIFPMCPGNCGTRDIQTLGLWGAPGIVLVYPYTLYLWYTGYSDTRFVDIQE